MTLEYETVVYNEGDIDGNDPASIVTGFGMKANYDRTRSPIAPEGSNSLVQGQAGLLLGGNMNNLTNPAQGQQAAQIAYNYSKQYGSSTSQVSIQESKAVDQPNSTRNLFAQYPSYNASGNGSQSSAPIAPSTSGAVTETPSAGSQNNQLRG